MQGSLDFENLGIKIYPNFKKPYEIKVIESDGAHGGGDDVMLDDIFGTPPADIYKRSADYVQGAHSILVGIAANISMESDKLVRISDLVKGLGDPNYVQNNNNDDVIPFSEAARCVARDGQQIAANLPSEIKE